MPQITPQTEPQNIIQAKTGRSDNTRMASVPELATAPETLDAATPVDATPVSTDSSKLVELARRTKAQRALQVQLQKEKEDIDNQKAAMLKKTSEYETNYIPKDRLKNDLVTVLSELGYDTEALSAAFQSQPVATNMTIMKLQKKIEELESKADQTAKSFEENKSSQYQNAISQIRSETKRLIAKDDSYELIKAEGAEEKVIDYIKSTFENGIEDEEGNELVAKGTVLTVEEAAQKIEADLLVRAEKLLQLKKVKEKMIPVADPAKTPTQTPNPKLIKTLTNNMTGSAPKSLSVSERRARAIAIASGQIPQ